MKPNKVEKLRSELNDIKDSGISISEYTEKIGKDSQYIYNKIQEFKSNFEQIAENPDILPLYESIKNIKVNKEEERGMSVTYIRDENNNIVSYDIYYPVKDSVPFITRLTRNDVETLFGLYTYYGGNITSRQVSNEFPQYTLAEVKRIFRCFKLTKDSSWAAPHLLEELNEEQLAQYRMNLKERAAFKYCDAKMERDFTNQIKKMASEINQLKDKREVIKSLLGSVDYEKVTVKPVIESNTTTGIICLSDLHIGAFNVPEGYIDIPEYSEEEINRRLDYIIKSIQDKKWNCVIVLNLGDNVDSYRKMTSSMTHQLPCVFTDKQIAQMYIRVMMRFFNQLHSIFKNNVKYYSIGSGNHSSTWGWLLDITLSQQLSKEFNIDTYVSNKEIDSIDVNGTSFIYLHGKSSSEKGQFKGFPLNLNEKTQCWFNDFFADTDLKLQKRKVVLKGDLHQYAINSVSSFDYINCPSIYGSSCYIVSNFGLTPWACVYIEVDRKGNYVSGLIRE